MVESEETHINNKPWMRSEESCEDNNGFLSEEINAFVMSEHMIHGLLKPQSQSVPQNQSKKKCSSDTRSTNLAANALSAAGAAFLSAVIVNPLDVAKTRLQAQAAGAQYAHPLSNALSRMAVFGPNMLFADLRCSPSCARAGIQGTVSMCPPDCFQYKGTLDVLCKIVQQEGVTRLWRGTNAGLALAIPMVGIYLPFYDVFRIRMEEFAADNVPSVEPYVPFVAGALARSLACTTCYPIELARTRMQAFKETGKKPPGVLKTLIGVVSNAKNASSQSKLQSYRVLWTGLGAQLARDVPFSAICWSTLEPMRRRLSTLTGDEASAITILGSNFASGFVAGSLAAGATCPLDVARTRRQIEKDPHKALRMTTRTTLMEIWRDGGIKGLFAGASPRIARAGPSVGIVVSFYEVVKYIVNTRITPA
ncbi:mitochondrial carrier protein MTM1-like [Chenopodium quinoa]|uniref:mitochondrial carrier protein MTM1-like n=1 Tax=Chenopodium quinoa TaxID=63459 RepID=UPI000B76BABB|nr:mitochondrial carrier protein MTM1-like [Chenopodium quinoa]XP_021729023.1 mitochondrial carrier protein MTM1-like [Chenopodium quinoa]